MFAKWGATALLLLFVYFFACHLYFADLFLFSCIVKFLVCAKGTRYLVKIIVYMYKIIRNKSNGACWQPRSRLDLLLKKPSNIGFKQLNSGISNWAPPIRLQNESHGCVSKDMPFTNYIIPMRKIASHLLPNISSPSLVLRLSGHQELGTEANHPHEEDSK